MGKKIGGLNDKQNRTRPSHTFWMIKNKFIQCSFSILLQYIFFFENYQYPNGIYGNFQLTNVVWNTVISLYFFEENFAFSLVLHAWSNLNITRSFQVGKKKKEQMLLSLIWFINAKWATV